MRWRLGGSGGGPLLALLLPILLAAAQQPEAPLSPPVPPAPPSPIAPPRPPQWPPTPPAPFSPPALQAVGGELPASAPAPAPAGAPAPAPAFSFSEPVVVYGRCPFSFDAGSSDSSDCVVTLPPGEYSVSVCSPAAVSSGDTQIAVLSGGGVLLGRNDDDGRCKNPLGSYVEIQNEGNVVTVRLSCFGNSACSGVAEVTSRFDPAAVTSEEAYTPLSEGCARCAEAPTLRDVLMTFPAFPSQPPTGEANSACAGQVAARDVPRDGATSIMSIARVVAALPLKLTNVRVAASAAAARVVVVVESAEFSTARLVFDGRLQKTGPAFSVPLSLEMDPGREFRVVVGVFPLQQPPGALTATPSIRTAAPFGESDAALAVTFGVCVDEASLALGQCVPDLAFEYDGGAACARQQPSPPPTAAVGAGECLPLPAPGSRSTLQLLGCAPPLCAEAVPVSSGPRATLGGAVVSLSWGGAGETLQLRPCNASKPQQLFDFVPAGDGVRIVTNAGFSVGVRGLNSVSPLPYDPSAACAGGPANMVSHATFDVSQAQTWTAALAGGTCGFTFAPRGFAVTPDPSGRRDPALDAMPQFCPKAATDGWTLEVSAPSAGQSVWLSNFAQAGWPWLVVPVTAPAEPVFPSGSGSPVEGPWSAISLLCPDGVGGCGAYPDLDAPFQAFLRNRFVRTPNDAYGGLSVEVIRAQDTLVFRAGSPRLRNITRAVRLVSVSGSPPPVELSSEDLAVLYALFLPAEVRRDNLGAAALSWGPWAPAETHASSSDGGEANDVKLGLGLGLGFGGGIVVVSASLAAYSFFAGRPSASPLPVVGAASAFGCAADSANPAVGRRRQFAAARVSAV